MDWDEIMDPSSQDFQEAMNEQLRVVHMQDGLVAAAQQLTLEYFPAAANLTPAEQKKLQRVIINYSVQMANAIQEALYRQMPDE